MYQPYFISKLKSIIYTGEDIKFQQKKYMAIIARGIGERSSAVQLNASFGKVFYFNNLLSQSATLPVYLFVSLFVNLHFFYLTIFQR